MGRNKAIYSAYKQGGIGMALAHLSGRVFGISKFLRPASTIDFRKAELKSAKSARELISLLITNHKDIDSALEAAKKLLILNLPQKTGKLHEPSRWNSGLELQQILIALVILTKPEVVVETGTANGASAAAILAGLEYNKAGHLWSFDIKPANPVLVDESLKQRATFVKVSGKENDLLKQLLDIKKSNKGFSIFLHDADHSFLGQQSDYKLAKNNGFDLILSDDIDASLAFCEFAKAQGVTLYDAPKFIGAVRNLSI
jgi:predicted O-methyltransferase YrrM